MYFTSLIRNNEFIKSGYQKKTHQEYFRKQLQNSNVIKPLTFFNLFRNILLNFGDFYTLQLFWQVFLAEMGCLVSSMPIKNCVKCVYFISLEFFFESKLKSRNVKWDWTRCFWLTLSSCLVINGPLLMLAPKYLPLSSPSGHELEPYPRTPSSLSWLRSDPNPFLLRDNGAGINELPSLGA